MVIGLSSPHLLISVHKHDAEGSGLELTAGAHHLHVVALTDVVDVHGDGGVRAYAVLLHKGNELTLCQVLGWGRLLLRQLRLQSGPRL